MRTTIARNHLHRFFMLALLLAPASAHAQTDTTILKRWVGTYAEGKPLTIEFYGDSMLVVGDRYALTYRMTYDSLIATGDTNVVARYRIAMGRLLLEVPDGNVVTMATQRTLGRPLTGRWVGELDFAGSLRPVEINLNADRSACWHSTAEDSKWSGGEWERETRRVTLTWEADEWTGIYDPQGNSLLLQPVQDSLHTGTGPSGVLRRVYRGNVTGAPGCLK
jgi:hypothetical protein